MHHLLVLVLADDVVLLAGNMAVITVYQFFNSD